MTPLSQIYDAALLDLDGTVYLGGTVIDHVVPALDAVRAAGMATVFVTNNASRPPSEVADALQGMGIQAAERDVLTSPQVAADLLAAGHPAGSPVLVVGAPYLHAAVAAVGLVPVSLATDHPVAIVQGHSPETGWQQLAEACLALRTGADWVACNTDSTLPTDRGLLPGNGAMVAALVTATGRHPRVAGKPGRPLLDGAIALSGSRRPLVVGDRLDTDIEAAAAAGLASLMPLTGVSTAADLLPAPPAQRPTYVSFDLRGLHDPARVVALPDPDRRALPGGGSTTKPGEWTVSADAGRLILTATRDEVDPADDGVTLRALAALLTTAWQQPVPVPVTVTAVGRPATEALARLQIARRE